MKKKANVLLSIYNPNYDYLKSQLQSINNQDYTNIEVLIFDDCVEKRCDVSIFKRYLTKVTYKLLPYKEKNMGYVRAFEYLTENADGEYIFYCDQDDVWKKNKVSNSILFLKKNHLNLMSTDREIIDSNGHIVCSSYDNKRGYPYNLKLDDLIIFKENFFTTYADGMCICGRTDFIKRCLPFSLSTAHDKWLISCACIENTYARCSQILVQYRRHENNVSGRFKDIKDKSDYFDKRVMPNYHLAFDLQKKYPEYTPLFDIYNFCEARVNKKIFTLLKKNHISKKIAIFEFVIFFCPNYLSKYIFNLLRK